MFILRHWKSESLQFDNASIYVQFDVIFIMYFDISLYCFNHSFEGFSVTDRHCLIKPFQLN